MQKESSPSHYSEQPGRTNNCLFEEDWWLDAVAPGAWHSVEVHVGGQLHARMPIAMSKTFGLTSIRQPPLTQTLGPWYRPGTGKYCVRLAREKDLAVELISKLPAHRFFSVNFHHSITNWLPFFWNGFNAVPKMTYLIPNLDDETALWNEIQDKTRSEIRKAQKTLEVVVLDDVERFIDINSKTFARQGLRPPHSPDVVKRLDEACATHQARRMFFAMDESRRVHSAVYIVWDDRCAYYLMGGGDPELRNSGASSLLVWEAMRHASKVSRSFDFEGSMGESIERFFRAFGPQQKPYLNVRRAGRTLGFALNVRDAFRSLRGR